MFIDYLSDKHVGCFIFYCNFDVKYNLNSYYNFEEKFPQLYLINILKLTLTCNQPIVLPPLLKKLKLGFEFNQSIIKEINFRTLL